MKVLIIGLLLTASNICFAQTFSEFMEQLEILPHPLKFNEAWPDSLPEYNLPPEFFDNPVFDLSNDKAFAKIAMDSNYSIILIRRSSEEGGYFSLIIGVSFDASGNYIDKIALSHDTTGEGSVFSITPDNKIRVADYGAMEAVINTYGYENGQFIKEGGPEYGDVDNLPDY